MGDAFFVVRFVLYELLHDSVDFSDEPGAVGNGHRLEALPTVRTLLFGLHAPSNARLAVKLRTIGTHGSVANLLVTDVAAEHLFKLALSWRRVTFRELMTYWSLCSC